MILNPLEIEFSNPSEGWKSSKLFPKGPEENHFLEIMERSMEAQEGNTKISGKKVFEYVVRPGDTLWKIGVHLFCEDPYKIAKDNGIRNPDLIFPGQKLKIFQSQVKGPYEVVASWYGEEYHHKPTASGEKFDMFQNTLAHRTLPFGTIVKLTNPENGRTVVGRINDRGPFIRGRDVDLSYGLAERLGMVQKGVGKLIMEIL